MKERKETSLKDKTKEQKQGKRSSTPLRILLAVSAAVLAWFAFLLILRMHGYDGFSDWMKQSVRPTGGKVTGIPLPTGTEETAETPTPTVSPTPTALPTPTPTFLEALVISGEESIDADIRRQAAAFAPDAGAALVYEVYRTGNYLSVVFHKAEEFEGESVEVLLPLVYDLTLKKQVTGSDLIKESYFAIIKERLQQYTIEIFEKAEGTEFVTYQQIYRAEDYQKFYMTEDSLIFCFDGNVLFEEGQKPFVYRVPLEEAKAFFYYDLDGTKSGIPLRQLDPEKPMIAFTFDDGPNFVRGSYLDNIDLRLLTLFQEYDGRATFFYLGERLDAPYENTYGKVAKMAYEAGFEVASHTYSHTLNFGASSEEKKEAMWQEFNKTNEVIAKVTGHAPDYVRLPGGTVGKWSAQFPLPIVNWSIDSIDYREKKKSNGAQIILNRMKGKEYQDGDILLFHSIYETTYDAVVQLLPYLEEQGFQFVTLSELFYYRGVELKDGVVHYNGLGKTNETL